MTSSPLWLRALLINAAQTTLEPRPKVASLLAARLHFICLLLSFTLLGYICGLIHLFSISKEYCQ